MKVIVKHKNSGIDKKHYDFYNEFVKYLQKQYPLKGDVIVSFLGDRTGSMTTGSRNDNEIKVLTKNRMNRDICRTLAHEWVHEYQMTILNREMGPDIGGQNEDEANAEAGKVIKKFEKQFPNMEEMMYEQVIINLLKKLI